MGKIISLFIITIMTSASHATEADFTELFEHTFFSSGAWKEFQEHLLNTDKLQITCARQGDITLETSVYKFSLVTERGRVVRRVMRKNGNGFFQNAEEERVHGYVFEALEPHRQNCNASALTARIQSDQRANAGLANRVQQIFRPFGGGQRSQPANQ